MKREREWGKECARERERRREREGEGERERGRKREGEMRESTFGWYFFAKKIKIDGWRPTLKSAI